MDICPWLYGEKIEEGRERKKMKRSTIQRGRSDRIVALTRRFSIGQFGRATREQTHGKRGDRDPSGTTGIGRGGIRFGRNRWPFRCLVSMPGITIRYDDESRTRARKLLATRRRNACKFPNKCVISVSRTSAATTTKTHHVSTWRRVLESFGGV